MTIQFSWSAYRYSTSSLRAYDPTGSWNKIVTVDSGLPALVIRTSAFSAKAHSAASTVNDDVTLTTNSRAGEGVLLASGFLKCPRSPEEVFAL